MRLFQGLIEALGDLSPMSGDRSSRLASSWTDNGFNPNVSPSERQAHICVKKGLDNINPTIALLPPWGGWPRTRSSLLRSGHYSFDATLLETGPDTCRISESSRLVTLSTPTD